MPRHGQRSSHTRKPVRGIARSIRGSHAPSRQPRLLSALPGNPFGYALVATLGVGAGLAALTAISMLATVLLYVGLALFLTLALEPLIQALTIRRVPRGAAAGILALGSLLITGFIGAVAVPAISSQLVALGVQLYESVERVPEQDWFVWLSGVVSQTIDLDDMANDAANFFSDPDKLLALGGGVVRVGSGIVDGLTGALIVSVLTTYFVLTLPALKAKAYALIARPSRSDVTALSEEMVQSVGRYVGGQFLLAALSSAITFILTSAVGSPAPAVLATLAFVGSLIPVFGPVVASAISVLVTFIEDPTAALIVAIALLIYMQVEAYVLTPKVMTRAVKVPGALVIIAALAGVALGGVLGAFVAVPVAAAAVTIVNKVVIPRQQGRRAH